MIIKKQKGSILIFTILLLTALSFVIWRDMHLSTLKIFKSRFAFNKLQSAWFAKAGYTLSLANLSSNNYSLNQKNSIEFNDGYSEYFIYNEDGKLNLNNLIDLEGVINKPYEKIVKHVFQELNINENDLDIIYDWIDEDSIERKNGAENKYYAVINLSCKNNFFSTPSELFLLKNFKNLKTKFPAKEFKQYFTVASNPKINLNSCPLLILKALNLSQQTSENIINYRNEKGAFKTIEDLKKIAGITPGILQTLKPIISVENNYFLIYSVGYYNKLKTAIESVIHIDNNHNLKTIYYSEALVSDS